METTVTIKLTEAIAASRSGDRDAFGQIVAQYQDMVCAVAFSHTGDRALSEDIAQETFLVAWQRLDRLRNEERFSAWLAAIARNRANDALRKRYREPLAQERIADRAAPDAPTEDERITVVWDALEKLPIQYREPLVLFYREGQSVAETAAALGLTEDCVKQRLSRGRGMLRDRVASLVETTLEETRPSTAFTIAVMTALPAFVGAQAAAQVAAESAAAGLVGKSAAVGGAAMAGGLTGAFAGMMGGFFGMWGSIKNAPTLRARRYMLKMSAFVYALVWLFLSYQAVAGLALWPQPRVMIAVCILGWVLYIPFLLVYILKSNRTAMRIVREDTGVDEPPNQALEESPYSLKSVRRAGYWSLGLSSAASLGVAWWLESLPGVHAGVVGLAIAGISHYVFWRLYRHGMRISADEIVFTETAPKHGAEAWLNPHKHYKGPSRRARYWNDMGATFGVVWGPSAWLLIAPALGGEAWLSILVALNCMAVTAASAWLLHRWLDQRHRISFGICLYMGIVSGLLIALFVQPEWAASRGMEIVYGWVGGAIFFGLYFVIGLAGLLTTRWQQKLNAAQPGGENSAERDQH
jgi:RNA polymerase sigma factor (sigma-70 family)